MIKWKCQLLLSGTLVASGILQVSDIATYKLPEFSINFCLLIFGSFRWCRFAEKTIKEVATILFSFIATSLLVLLGLIAAYVAVSFVDNNF